MIHRLVIAMVFIATAGMAQDAPKPKLGPNAAPIETDHAYLQANPAPDYWAFAAFTKPQFTSSACSVATITAALNGLLGLPSGNEDEVMSQPQLLDLVDDDAWKAASAEEGIGVTFDQLVDLAQRSLTARKMSDYKTDVFQPSDASEAEKTLLRQTLTKNEASKSDVMMIYFNQGVVTGDWDGPHISLIGAYDAATDRVLVLEVDQQWYTPYWTPTDVLLAAMLRPAPEDQGPLAGQTGGYVYLHK